MSKHFGHGAMSSFLATVSEKLVFEAGLQEPARRVQQSMQTQQAWLAKQFCCQALHGCSATQDSSTEKSGKTNSPEFSYLLHQPYAMRQENAKWALETTTKPGVNVWLNHGVE